MKLGRMEQPAKGVVDYRGVLLQAANRSCGVVKFLLEELPYIWRDAYLEMTSHPTEIVR